MKRTEPLKQFTVLPLHVPIVENNNYINDTDNQKNNNNNNINSYDYDINSSDNHNDEENTIEDSIILLKPVNFGSPRVYILVSGHVDPKTDPRDLWGADGVVTTLETNSNEV